MTGASHSKGAAFRAFLEWCRKEYGEQAAVAAFHQLPAELRKYIDSEDHHWGIVVSSWYPDTLLNGLLANLFDPLSESARRDDLRKATGYATEKTFNGIYRQFVRFALSPSAYARHADRLWHLYYDTGSVTSAYSHGRIVFEVAGWGGHHPYRCEIVRCSVDEAFNMMGCKNVHVERTRCVSSGAGACQMVVTWDAGR